ncbi:GxxExxY protein [Telluribacter sp.]|jgi:GxxExxY protein|uniref:GxxExxY protein n=1 Tax=Telluribacter sp. TaxID=1978767 RepID=UPI002E0F391A|nr:GxxExxY protein [Telluribacter sp.]
MAFRRAAVAEVVYQRALAVELANQGVHFVREQERRVFYKEVEVGIRRVDFFVENQVLVELKAQIEMTVMHLAQTLNYLEAFQLEVGLLINFGSRSLEFKRVLNKKHKAP